MKNNIYKMVVCDCDNTLITTYGDLTDDNITAIRKIMDMGIEFVIASGRNDLLLTEYVKQIDREITLIGCNGATIRNLSRGLTYRNEVIPKKVVKAMTDYFKKSGIDFEIYTIDASYSFGLDLKKKITALTGIVYSETVDFESVPIENTDNTDEFDVLKVVVIDRNSVLRDLQKYLKNFEGINAVLSADVCLDIISDKATKGSALISLADMLKIDPSRIIAFGDTENDISMLKSAGLSVAMGNATDEVKKVCKITTKTNNESGVAYVLNEIFDLGMY